MQLLKTIAIVLIFAAGVSADEWKTTDGNISVVVPDPTRFAPGQAVSPLSVIWVSNDETIKLGVVELDFPRDVTLIQSSVEQGLAQEVGGKIVESSQKQQAGHDVFLMTAHGKLLGSEVYISQAVVAIQGKGYKIMAIGLGKDARVDPDAADFMSSFKILTTKEAAAAWPSKDAPNSYAAQNAPNFESPVDNLSQRIGGISALILIVCGIAFVISRFTKRRNANDGGPR